MAKIVDSEIDSQPIISYNPVWHIVSVGVILGILYCALTALISKLFGLASVAGDISTILVATVGIVVMLNLRMARPLVVALASAISLWGLSKLTAGLGWVEIVLWSAFLYGISYLLFSWLIRYRRFLPVLLVICLIVIIVRLTITL